LEKKSGSKRKDENVGANVRGKGGGREQLMGEKWVEI